MLKTFYTLAASLATAASAGTSFINWYSQPNCEGFTGQTLIDAFGSFDCDVPDAFSSGAKSVFIGLNPGDSARIFWDAHMRFNEESGAFECYGGYIMGGNGCENAPDGASATGVVWFKGSGNE